MSPVLGPNYLAKGEREASNLRVPDVRSFPVKKGYVRRHVKTRPQLDRYSKARFMIGTIKLRRDGRQGDIGLLKIKGNTGGINVFG